MTSIRFTVYGHPEPAGSKRALPLGGRLGGRPIVVDANRKAAPWKAHVASQAQLAYRGLWLIGPVSLSLHFILPRPKGHYGSGRNEGNLRASAPPYPNVKPDLLKLARGVEDALTGIIYRDDAQIVRETLAKDYGMPERVEIVIEELPACTS